jgi:hypothetical protein
VPSTVTNDWVDNSKAEISTENATIDIASYEQDKETPSDDDFDTTFTGRNMVNVKDESVYLGETVDYSARWEQADDATKERASSALSTLLNTYPTIMACSFKQMQAAELALLKVGVRRRDLPHLIYRQPTILRCDPQGIYTVISFLQYNCGLKKVHYAYIHMPTYICLHTHAYIYLRIYIATE